MPTRVQSLWLVLACTGMGAVALAQEPGTPPAPGASPTHGAATMDAQNAAVDKLGLSADGSKIPKSLDAHAWRSAVPSDNPLDAKRIALGRKLYFETTLSNDGSVACATCHDATRSFTDRRPVSEGIGGQLGRRNAPTTMNAALLGSQFWDGREGTLEQQAGQPILNPVEMAMPSREAAVQRLKGAGYDIDFQAVFGTEVTYENVERAIAAFERTLLFLDAPFDRFIAGAREAITEEARAGFVLFNGKARCVTCHTINRSNPLGTDNRFHNIGVSARNQNFEELAKRALATLAEDNSKRKLDDLAIATDLSELGRFMVSKSYADIGAFRTPQLRNVGITGPYMHDGSMQTLWDTLDHYNKGGEPNAYLDGGMESLALTENEIDQLVAFMFTLSDDRFAQLSGEEHARQRQLAQRQRPFRDEAVAQRKQLDFEKRALGKARLGAPKEGGQ